MQTFLFSNVLHQRIKTAPKKLSKFTLYIKILSDVHTLWVSCILIFIHSVTNSKMDLLVPSALILMARLERSRVNPTVHPKEHLSSAHLFMPETSF